MLHTYTANSDPSYIVGNVRCVLATALEESWSPWQLMARTEVLLQETSAFTCFKEYVYQLAEKDEVWHLWADFAFVNCHSHCTYQFIAVIGIYIWLVLREWPHYLLPICMNVT